MNAATSGGVEAAKWKSVVLAVTALTAAWLASYQTVTFASSFIQNGLNQQWRNSRNSAAPSRLANEYQCAMTVLKAPSLAVVKKRRAVCSDAFVVRASYAWWLTEHRAPGAVDAIISAAPRSSMEMEEFYKFVEDTNSQLANRAHMACDLSRARVSVSRISCSK